MNDFNYGDFATIKMCRTHFHCGASRIFFRFGAVLEILFPPNYL